MVAEGDAEGADRGWTAVLLACRRSGKQTEGQCENAGNVASSNSLHKMIAVMRWKTRSCLRRTFCWSLPRMAGSFASCSLV